MTTSPEPAKHPPDVVAAIAGEDPCGAELGRSAGFFELRNQATAAEQVSATPTDWAWVQSESERILTHHSKDLRVASYLAMAYLHREGTQGLIWGLDMLTTMLDTFAQGLFPRPKRGSHSARLGVLQWYLDSAGLRCGAQLVNGTPTQASRALEKLSALAQSCERIFDGEKIRISELRISLERMQLSGVSPKDASATAVEQARPGPPESGQAPSDRVSRNGAWLALRTWAHELREQDPRCALAYRLLRSALWTPINAAPTHDAAGRCQVPLPSANERDELRAHAAAGRWAGLLERTETLLSKYPLCLDLQRDCVVALEGIGDADDAIQSIQVATLALVSRMPELLELRGETGEALANASTRQWIEQKQNPAPPAHNEDSQGPPSWWRDISNTPVHDPQARIEALQRALEQAPDRVSFARRAIFAARKLDSIEGLAPLLGAWALRTLKDPGHRTVSKALEQECWNLVYGGLRVDHAWLDTGLLDHAQVDLAAALRRSALAGRS